MSEKPQTIYTYYIKFSKFNFHFHINFLPMNMRKKNLWFFIWGPEASLCPSFIGCSHLNFKNFHYYCSYAWPNAKYLHVFPLFLLMLIKGKVPNHVRTIYGQHFFHCPNFLVSCSCCLSQYNCSKWP